MYVCKQGGRQNIVSDELLSFRNSKKAIFINYEANFEKCYHQYSKRYAIQIKVTNTCVNKIN
jgi:hypothetical protein